MNDAPITPTLHFFVCANRRGDDSPLGPGCAAAGDVVFDALKGMVAARGAYRSIWVTRTHCLGVCPPKGCTVAIYPKQRIVSGVEASDARGLFDRAAMEVTS